ncbi:Sugar lactone lactonase YvrE [Rhodoblastus acidophilus]|uniref:Sugar lactone lactonase YvrE n=1 Tax=Rhodoblastus acidophilus TaxID=1074 RepID=A0A212Q320_RHOAC|nr:SMP-30/gluconolactonase/LRE family protein [Rhodoblastus acidophilus]PPQ37153.1 gluconolactonase [Rhodoblastus acidophilus]RAI18138.1 gluconolactonase [Rhodoblastus acidophilus]SNB53599.1 Sugar lactone lactonase YvrE [Rhodoblastus acidophilus]
MAGVFALALDCRCQLGESPVWLADAQALLFVDIKGRRLHRFAPETGAHEAVAVDEEIGCVAPVRDGGLIAGLRSGLWLLRRDGSKLRLLAANPEDHATSRFNDGRVDPRGRYLAGTVDEPKAGGAAGLYRYDARGLTRIAQGLLTSNGLAFSPDGRTLYHADTPRYRVDRYDYDPETGAVANRRMFVQLDPAVTGRARPDGAAVDAQGCYWTALYDGGRVHRYSPDGDLIASYPVPTARPTMPAFGGARGTTVFVTSARDEAGDGGGLFAMEADVAGAPPPAFDPSV